ncbi:MAG: 2-dehydropantoate 2-reductase [Deltaproteobacteria bacterium]|nr:2-dehydropantoate 2-reductase [Deltaproteobacteria bacterium]
MRALIVGTGAVGGYFGAKLARAGHAVVFVARGENLRALAERGLEIDAAASRSRLCPVRAVASARGEGPFDLVLVCVKVPDTASALGGVAAELAPRAIVLSLQNGIESEPTIERLLGLPPLLRALAYVGAELVAPGVVRHTSGGTIVVGEIGALRSERLERLRRWLEEASIEVVVAADILRAKWQKLAWNAAFNLVAALGGATIGAILDRPEARRVIAAAMAEVEAVARAEGVEFEPDYVHRVMSRADRDHRAVRPSTLQDRDRRKPLEHAALCGAVVRFAARHGIPTPVNETLDALARLASG